jgi:hypothetical protein
MNCHEWSMTDTNNDYFADCSQTDALYVNATICAAHAAVTGHPTTAEMANSYPCEEGGYGPLTSPTRAGHPGHMQFRADNCAGEVTDDPAFRDAKGFSCAQWNVKRPNGIIACLPSEDAHWIAHSNAYTQAELDSLRTNCPATCLFDAAGAFTTMFGGVATVATCAYWAEDRDENQVADCMATEDAKRKDEDSAVSYTELDAIRKACPVLCGECARKHFYYPAFLMKQVRLHCPKACGVDSSSCSSTPFG